MNDEGYEEEANEELCLSSITSLQGVELQDPLRLSNPIWSELIKISIL